MSYDFRKKPGTPGDILEHHGVKGMRWGVRNEEKTSADVAQRNEDLKNELAKELFTGQPASKNVVPVSKTTSSKRPPATPWHSMSKEQKQKVARDLTGTDDISKVDPESKRSRLTPNQKKAMLAVGVAGVGLAGFVAYKHFAGKSAVDPTTFGVGELSKKYPALALKDTHELSLSTAKGYADFRPKDGFLNPQSAARHAELIDAVDRMRAQFPAVRNMNIEVVPMSYGGTLENNMMNSGAMATVMSFGKGEARICYNDLMQLDKDEMDLTRTLISDNLFVPGYMGNHEMGHLLASAHGELPGLGPVFGSNNPAKQIAGLYNAVATQGRRHKKIMQKHGFTFEELSKLSPYAATKPAEALAELAGHYFTPETRAKMDPDMARRAKAMFDELGGVL